MLRPFCIAILQLKDVPAADAVNQPVEYKIRGEQHVMREFVSLTSKSYQKMEH